MGRNIFNIWEEIGKKTPFAARRTHWSNKNIYVIVQKVVPDGKGYGVAYGYPTTNGVLNTYFSHNKKWCQNKEIPNPGVYGWEHTEGVNLNINKGVNYKNENEKITKQYNKSYDLKSKIHFGKYNNRIMKNIIESDPNYIIWAISNVEWFSIQEEALNLLLKQVNVSENVIKSNNYKLSKIGK
ncbi:MAG: hypothetical protein FH761_07470 [Firmicutes bacterium]|nr:hypothetical protein [Bacillota bacterium]